MVPVYLSQLYLSSRMLGYTQYQEELGVVVSEERRAKLETHAQAHKMEYIAG